MWVSCYVISICYTVLHQITSCHIISNHIISDYTVLYCIAIYCVMLYYMKLYIVCLNCIVILYYTIRYHIMLCDILLYDYNIYYTKLLSITYYDAGLLLFIVLVLESPARWSPIWTSNCTTLLPEKLTVLRQPDALSNPWPANGFENWQIGVANYKLSQSFISQFNRSNMIQHDPPGQWQSDRQFPRGLCTLWSKFNAQNRSKWLQSELPKAFIFFGYSKHSMTNALVKIYLNPFFLVTLLPFPHSGPAWAR